MEEKWQAARMLIRKGQLGAALNLLHDYVDEHLQNEILLYQFRLNNLKRAASVFQKDISSDQLELCDVVLQFIATNENENQQAAILPAQLYRNGQLKKNLIRTYQLIEQWEEKLESAENPTEQRRSKIEIQRLQKIVQSYLQELE